MARGFIFHIFIFLAAGTVLSPAAFSCPPPYFPVPAPAEITALLAKQQSSDMPLSPQEQDMLDSYSQDVAHYNELFEKAYPCLMDGQDAGSVYDKAAAEEELRALEEKWKPKEDSPAEEEIP